MTEPAPSTAPLKRTPLIDYHRRHGAHLVPFAGWEMPLYYGGILEEHKAVRAAVGLFDVSHMGVLTVDGAGAAALLSRRTTANVEKLTPGQVKYAFLLEATGRIVDDLLVSRLDAGDSTARRYLVVPNAARADEVEEILRQHRTPDTTIARRNEAVGLLAVQGPGSRKLLEGAFGWSLGGLGFYRLAFFSKAAGGPDAAGRLGLEIPAALADHILVSRTGYTGERGYELIVAAKEADAIAERLTGLGAQPTGLGARDTLRLEMGYLLSGQDFHRDRSPVEAAQERFVDFDHEFVGRAALEKERSAGSPVVFSGIATQVAGAIPRHGTPVLAHGTRVAEATSGGLAPSVGHGIALAYLPREFSAPGTPLDLEIRGRPVPAKVVALPFYRAPPTRG
ncbi:MAG TPA: glycine cleavage system aminomethyltransferase GcvT [Thermoplasmata archaeon]|nr:glycine cleavage system aminomethyltransferase GcvT [Thermoplasmata archaeon]